MRYITPAIHLKAFTCSHCNTCSQQLWDYIRLLDDGSIERRNKYDFERVSSQRRIAISTCVNCKERHIWLSDELIFPEQVKTPMPNQDMPEKVKKIYSEAAYVYPRSAKAAAALLRLAVQYLCVELGGLGKNINDDIGKLVEKGLDVRIQKALDIIRVTGNNAVHPGTMDLQDDDSTAYKLFELINFIVNQMITQPKGIDNIYEELPIGAKEAIERRDSR
ncbi:DUF4145 domain-containing protein [Clostridium botulinum]|uniref:DUF4145 domain-containing protein n=1 Tax=Clostridium botulinum TaxID=1491 RepID=UPI001C9BAEE7|nr:DUF4145 domain-containing protein [Clostridium botulinum]MBY6844645.1 DUF4145 domain-containing protein [Clostridium botulinum]